MPQNPFSPLRNEGQVGVLPGGGQNNTSTETSSDASYQGHDSTFIGTPPVLVKFIAHPPSKDKNISPITILGQGANNEAQSRGMILPQSILSSDLTVIALCFQLVLQRQLNLLPHSYNHLKFLPAHHAKAIIPHLHMVVNIRVLRRRHRPP